MCIFLNPSIQNLGIWLVEMKARERVYTSECLSLLTPINCKFMLFQGGKSCAAGGWMPREEDHWLFSNSGSKREQTAEWQQVRSWRHHQQLWREVGPGATPWKPGAVEPCQTGVGHIIFKTKRTAWNKSLLCHILLPTVLRWVMKLHCATDVLLVTWQEAEGLPHGVFMSTR